MTTFDNVTSSTAPAAGHAQFGPADTYHTISGIVPTLTTDATANSVSFGYGTYHDPSQRASVSDVLFTVTASNDPFVDGLFLTTQAHEFEGSTNNGTSTANAIVQIHLTEPVLTITKGAVAVDNPRATVSPNPYGFSAPGSSGVRFSGTIGSAGLATSPLTGTAAKFDAGDRVTFATVVQNLGTGLNGAFNVTLKDLLPAGFVIPAGGINLSVTDGTGAPLIVTNVGGGAGLFDQGIEVLDPGGKASLAAYDSSSGKNILVVTYDLQADATVTPGQAITNTASLTNYSATEGGPDFLTSPVNASSTSTVAALKLAKALTATDQAFTTGNQLAIGEVATYDVTLTLPEGITPTAQLVDSLPAGLAIVGVDSITPSSGNLTSSNGSWATVLTSGVTIASNGSSATFNLGTITNADRDNSVIDTITIQYRVVALNLASNRKGTTLTNSARFTYAGGSATASTPALVETPKLSLSTTLDKATAQAGDTVTYTVTIANAAGNGSGADAFNIAYADTLPAGLTYVAGSLAPKSGVPFTSSGVTGGTLSIGFATLALGSSATFTFQATVDSTTGPYQTLNDADAITYTSLPGTGNTAQSPYSPISTERTGNPTDPGGSANNLVANNSVPLNTVAPTATKVILSTSLPSLSGTNVTIGEKVQYRVTVIVPDGVSASSKLTDLLPAGMTLVSLDSLTASPSLSTSNSGGFSAVLSGATVGGGGLRFPSISGRSPTRTAIPASRRRSS